jgi:prolipoprotein diacylglyceryltransferase
MSTWTWYSAGITLGVLAGSVMAVYRNRSDGSIVTKAGTAYAAVWTAVIAGRILFAYGSDHWFAPQIANFSRGHALTGSAAWTAAFVIMAMSMVVARVTVTAVKAERSKIPHHPADLSHVGAW